MSNGERGRVCSAEGWVGNTQQLSLMSHLACAASSLLPLPPPPAATYALIAKYSVQDNNFGIGRERRFMMHVIECAKNVDVHTFLDHAWNLDYVIELREHQLK